VAQGDFVYDIAAAAVPGGSTTALTITIDGTTLDALPANNTLAGASVNGFQFFQNGSGAGFHRHPRAGSDGSGGRRAAPPRAPTPMPLRWRQALLVQT
jgi:hypothetical protein